MPFNYRHGFNNQMPYILYKLSISFCRNFVVKDHSIATTTIWKWIHLHCYLQSTLLLTTMIFDLQILLTVVLEGYTHIRNQSVLCCRAKNSNIFKLIHAGNIINDWINIKVIPKASHAHTYL